MFCSPFGNLGTVISESGTACATFSQSPLNSVAGIPFRHLTAAHKRRQALQESGKRNLRDPEDAADSRKKDSKAQVTRTGSPRWAGARFGDGRLLCEENGKIAA